MFLLFLVLALPHTLSSLSSPLTLRPLSLAALARSHLPLWVHTQPCTGSSPAHPQPHRDAQSPHHQHWDRQTDGQQGSPATFDKVEVRVHLICSIDGNIKLWEEEKTGVETPPVQHPGPAPDAAAGVAGPKQQPQMSPELGAPWCQPEHSV